MADDYPRPDFVRQNVNWQSLDGPWSFLFDDLDTGVRDRWHIEGLPEAVTVNSTDTNSSKNTGAPDIVAKIAAGTQELLQDNIFKKGGSVVNKKRDIQVPYVFQCPASGIHEQGVHEVLWYEREISDSERSTMRPKSGLVAGFLVGTEEVMSHSTSTSPTRSYRVRLKDLRYEYSTPHTT
jgi:hypothetical protein